MESYLKGLPAVLESALHGASPEGMQKAPPGKWNSTQILEHLYLSYTATTSAIVRRLETGTPVTRVGTLKQRLAVFVITGLGYLPTGIDAPAIAVPHGVPPQLVRETIYAEIEKMACALDDCERRFGSRTKIVDHPILGPLNVNQTRKLHFLHGRHHARQIRERANQ